jgi:RecA-family ATPase
LFEKGGQKFSLKFINEISPEYFKIKPKEKPRLLHFVDQSGRKIPFLHRGVVGMLVAEGGVGKTHLLALLALSISTGVPWIGKFMVEKPGPVCLILGENDSDDIHRLLSKVREHFVKMLAENSSKKDYERFMLHFQEPLDQLLVSLCVESVYGLDAGFIDAKGKKTTFYQKLLIELKAKEPPDGWQLIILDPASRFAGPETEKDNAIATAFIASLEHISNELVGRPTILVAHHKSKAGQRESAGQSDARGASGLTDGARWQANINKDKEDQCIWLEIAKTNFTPSFCKIRLKKDQDGVPVFDGFDLGEEGAVVGGALRSIITKKAKNGN